MIIVDGRAQLGPSINLKDTRIRGKDIIDNMDENGVQISLLQPMPSASAIEPKKLHDEAADLCSKYQKRLFGLACIPPQIGRDNYFELADYCINKLGFIGLKYHCLFHGGGARNPQAQYCWDAGKEFSVPVTIHTGLGIPLALPSLYLPIFQNYPEVNFILAHAGAWITVEEASLVSKMCPNVYIDTSWQYPQTLLGVIKEIGWEKMMMASDFPSNLPMQLMLYNSIGLSVDQKEHCLGKLAIKLFHLKHRI